jgi:hypothetical protein
MKHRRHGTHGEGASVGAHQRYGQAVQMIVVEELARQDDHGPTSDRERESTRVG